MRSALFVALPALKAEQDNGCEIQYHDNDGKREQHFPACWANLNLLGLRKNSFCVIHLYYSFVIELRQV